MTKRYWENEWQYQRILEILDDYWITEKDEARVMCEMHFLKSNGEFQKKQLIWVNPNLNKCTSEDSNIELPTMDEFGESSKENTTKEKEEVDGHRKSAT